MGIVDVLPQPTPRSDFNILIGPWQVRDVEIANHATVDLYNAKLCHHVLNPAKVRT